MMQMNNPNYMSVPQMKLGSPKQKSKSPEVDLPPSITEEELQEDKKFIIKHKFESVFSKLKYQKDEMF